MPMQVGIAYPIVVSLLTLIIRRLVQNTLRRTHSFRYTLGTPTLRKAV
jgi:hypothetical protein